MQRTTWRQAAITGLLFALVSCGWEFYRRAPELGELAFRFGLLFVTFTVFYRLVMNWVAKRDARKY